MPSTATITSFYTFAPSSKARASQVNANFDSFRGHIIPISPTTATASDNSWDLGSTGYRWKTGYVREIDFKSITTTGQEVTMYAATSGSLPYAAFSVAGTERLRIGEFGFLKNPSASYLNATTSAGIGGFAAVNLATSTTLNVTSVAASIVGSTITIVTYGGPVDVRLVAADLSSDISNIFLQAHGTTAGSFGPFVPAITILRDSAVFVADFVFSAFDINEDLGGYGVTYRGAHSVGTVQAIDFPSAGTHTYYLSYSGSYGGSGFTAMTMQITGAKFQARETF